MHFSKKFHTFSRSLSLGRPFDFSHSSSHAAAPKLSGSASRTFSIPRTSFPSASPRTRCSPRYSQSSGIKGRIARSMRLLMVSFALTGITARRISSLPEAFFNRINYAIRNCIEIASHFKNRNQSFCKNTGIFKRINNEGIFRQFFKKKIRSFFCRALSSAICNLIVHFLPPNQVFFIVFVPQPGQVISIFPFPFGTRITVLQLLHL